VVLLSFARWVFGHSYLQRAGILVALAASVLSSSTVWGRVRTPTSDPGQVRYEAPIGHRQPRPQDLPLDVQRKEQQFNAADRDKLDRLINRSICRGC
jgi:hypothetical protein